MTLAPLDIDAAANNPLDILEELVVANEWPFDRSGPDEMVVVKVTPARPSRECSSFGAKDVHRPSPCASITAEIENRPSEIRPSSRNEKLV